MKYKLRKWYPSLEKSINVGDVVKGGNGYNYSWPNRNLGERYIRSEEVKDEEYWSPYLFTTDDGVDVYFADRFYVYNKVKNYGDYDDAGKRHLQNNPSWIYFSTKEAAEKWVEEQSIPEYVELLEDNWGYKKGDIAKVVDYRDGGYEVFVPNRVSCSGLTPNVWMFGRSVKPSTKEAYDTQHTPKYEIGEWVIASITNTKYIGQYNGTTENGNIKLNSWCPISRIEQEDVVSLSGGSFTRVDRLATQEEISSYLQLLNKDTINNINISVPGVVVGTRQNGNNQVIIEYKTN